MLLVHLTLLGLRGRLIGKYRTTKRRSLRSQAVIVRVIFNQQVMRKTVMRVIVMM